MKNTILIYLFLLFTAISCKPALMLSIREGLKTGDHLKYRVTQMTETHATTPDGDKPTLETKITDYDYTVRAVKPDGSRELSMKFLRIQQTQMQNGTTSTYDSDAPVTDSSDLKGLIYRHFLNQDFTMTLTPGNEVRDFKGMEEMWGKMSASLSSQPMASAMLAGLKAQFSDENMARQASDLWNVYPSKAIKIGKKWSKSTTIPSFNLKQQVDFQLMAASPDSARVNFTTTMANEPGKPGQLDMGMVKISYMLSGTGYGTLVLNQPVATLRRSEQTTSMSGEMEAKVTGMAPQKVPLTIQTTMVTQQMPGSK